MRYLLYIIFFIAFSLQSMGQENARSIFEKAMNQFVTVNMELSMEVEETDNKGRVKGKSFDVLMAKFGEIEKTRMIMQAPERAKGVTIILTHLPDDIGLIEVFTPANGKTRKMKATAENMNRVGSNFSLSKYTSANHDNFELKLLGSLELDDKSCYQIAVREKSDSTGLKAEFLVEERSFHILQIQSFDEKGNKTQTIKLSDFQPISGLDDKIYPMLIESDDILGDKHTRMQVLKITPQTDLKEEDFILQAIIN